MITHQNELPDEHVTLLQPKICIPGLNFKGLEFGVRLQGLKVLGFSEPGIERDPNKKQALANSELPLATATRNEQAGSEVKRQPKNNP